MKVVVALLALLAATSVCAQAISHHTQPPPAQPPAKPRCSCWWQDTLVPLGAATALGVVVWKSRDGNQQVTVAPAAAAGAVEGRGVGVTPVVRYTITIGE